MVGIKAVLINSKENIETVKEKVGKDDYRLIAIFPAKDFIENTLGELDQEYSDDQLYAIFREVGNNKVFVEMKFYEEKVS